MLGRSSGILGVAGLFACGLPRENKFASGDQELPGFAPLH